MRDLLLGLLSQAMDMEHQIDGLRQQLAEKAGEVMKLRKEVRILLFSKRLEFAFYWWRWLHTHVRTFSTNKFQCKGLASLQECGIHMRNVHLSWSFKSLHLLWCQHFKTFPAFLLIAVFIRYLQLDALKRQGQDGGKQQLYQITGHEHLGTTLSIGAVDEKLSDLSLCSVQWYRIATDGSSPDVISGEIHWRETS